MLPLTPPSRTVSLPLLDRIDIASPCAANWNDMHGDDTTRHCADCNLNVINISSMTRDAAEAFLQEKFVGPAAVRRTCVRFYRRSDGTILTQDCPRGLAALRRRTRLALARFAAAIGLGTFFAVLAESTPGEPIRSTEPFPRLIEGVWNLSARLGLSRPARVAPTDFVGRVCIPPAPTSASLPTQSGGQP